MNWTSEDFRNGLCAVADVGKPRPTPDIPVVEQSATPAIQAPDPDAPKTLRELLKRDAMKAYVDLGGPEYLKANPDLLGKVLARVITPDPAPVAVNNNLNVWPEWLTSRRLAYQESAETAVDIELDPSGAPQALPVPERPAPTAPTLPPPEVVPAPPTPSGLAALLPADPTKVIRLSDL